MLETRMDSDYKVKQPPSVEVLEVMIANMKIFISTIKAWLQANPA